jgi:hypothetical protein
VLEIQVRLSQTRYCLFEHVFRILVAPLLLRDFGDLALRIRRLTD